MTMIISGTDGLTFNNSTTQASAGVVLQVVNATYGTRVTSASNVYVSTGLTATITPKFSTSKILVMVVHGGCGKSTGNTNLAFKVLRGSTVIDYDGVAGFTNSTATIYLGKIAFISLDSPATTSATTYSTQFCSDANLATVYINDTGQTQNGLSTITLMEIAA